MCTFCYTVLCGLPVTQVCQLCYTRCMSQREGRKTQKVWFPFSKYRYMPLLLVSCSVSVHSGCGFLFRQYRRGSLSPVLLVSYVAVSLLFSQYPWQFAYCLLVFMLLLATDQSCSVSVLRGFSLLFRPKTGT